MLSYLLPPHVHFCHRGNDSVFLDLRQDEYVLITGASAAALRVLTTGKSDDEPSRSMHAALEELLTAGLLVTDPEIGRPIIPTGILLPTDKLAPHDAPAFSFTFVQLCRWMAACTIAAAQLRWHRIDNIMARIKKRKAARSPGPSIDLQRTRELTAIFRTLRPFFPLNYLCLYDSLALIEFLAAYRIYPTWVFAVRLEPWGAHCWVQHEQFTLNEGIEEASSYTPVMAI